MKHECGDCREYRRRLIVANSRILALQQELKKRQMGAMTQGKIKYRRVRVSKSRLGGTCDGCAGQHNQVLCKSLPMCAEVVTKSGATVMKHYIFKEVKRGKKDC